MRKMFEEATKTVESDLHKECKALQEVLAVSVCINGIVLGWILWSLFQ